MATTTNYGWETPDDTDLVKDGALAQRTTGNAIDSTLWSVTGGKNVGMVLLNATTVTGASSTTISNVYSAAYRNYKIVVTGASSTSSAFLYTNTLSGSPATSNYSYGVMYITESVGPTRVSTSGVGFCQGVGMGNYGFNGEFLISNPAVADTTRIFNVGNKWNSTSSFEIANVGGLHLTATAYDGFKLDTSSGTWTGTIRVYGLRE